MRRRAVLGLFAAGAVTLVQGCGSDSSGGRTGGTGPAASPVQSHRPTYDPAGFTPPAMNSDDLRKLYKYDSKATLNSSLTETRSESGVRFEDITFTGVGDQTIPAYVISSAATAGSVAKRPCVVLAHDTGSNRDAWKAEGIDLVVQHGAVVVVPQIDFVPAGDPQGDSTQVINAVIGLRRALDLFTYRHDTDTTKLAVAGLGWGGALAQILAGVDTRLSAVVSMAAPSRYSMTACRACNPADGPGYMQAMTRFDGARYLAMTGAKRTVLAQFGKQDKNVDQDEAAKVAAAIVGTKDRKDYDTGHDLIGFAAAAADRVALYAKTLKTK